MCLQHARGNVWARPSVRKHGRASARKHGPSVMITYMSSPVRDKANSNGIRSRTCCGIRHGGGVPNVAWERWFVAGIGWRWHGWGAASSVPA